MNLKVYILKDHGPITVCKDHEKMGIEKNSFIIKCKGTYLQYKKSYCEACLKP